MLLTLEILARFGVDYTDEQPGYFGVRRINSTDLGKMGFMYSSARYSQANWSQFTKSKLASAGGQTVLPSRASSRKKEPFNCLNTTAQSPNNYNKTTWLELTEEAKLWKNWLELGENLSLIKFKPTPANSSQVGGQTIPNSIRVDNLARVGYR